MKLLSVVGARPQFVKMAPFVRALQRVRDAGMANLEHTLVHTGQHYDRDMSDVFFQELALPETDINLGVGSGPHGKQTGEMLARLEETLLHVGPDLTVVFGDTNSTLAGALAACKLHIPVAHVEAGLRSFNWRMPEEINRIATDHVCDLLFAPTPNALVNLKNENLGERAQWTGDVMYDAVSLYAKEAERRSNVIERLRLTPRRFGVVTIHRAENTDDRVRLRNILAALEQIAARGLELIFPVHPRTGQRLVNGNVEFGKPSKLRLIDPLGYLDMLQLLANAAVTLTDSGGLQKEAFFLGCPCITFRDETEWTETVDAGANVLVGADVDRAVQASARWLSAPAQRDHAGFASAARGYFGNSEAAGKIVHSIVTFLGGDQGTVAAAAVEAA